MHGPIPQLRPRPGQQHLKLRRLPAQNPGKQPDANALIALGIIDELELADLLEVAVLRPRIARDLEQPLLDIDEAGFAEPGGEVGVGGHGFAVLGRGFADEPGEEVVHGGFGEGGVVGAEAGVEFLEFEVAVGPGVAAGGCCVSFWWPRGKEGRRGFYW